MILLMLYAGWTLFYGFALTVFNWEGQRTWPVGLTLLAYGAVLIAVVVAMSVRPRPAWLLVAVVVVSIDIFVTARTDDDVQAVVLATRVMVLATLLVSTCVATLTHLSAARDNR